MAKDYRESISQSGANPSTLDEINRLNNDFTILNTHFRNEYEFQTAGNTIKAKKNVEAVLATRLTATSPLTYDLASPVIHVTKSEFNGKLNTVRYVLKNTKDVKYTIQQSQSGVDEFYEVSVAYENNVRYIFVSLMYPEDQKTPKRRKTELKGFAPTQRFIFHRQADQWILKAVEEVSR